MKYRRFGRTELQMPVFSCGGMRYQHKWEDVAPADIPKKNQENLEATIHRAVEVGINHIETARGYGTSEMQLGWVLPQLPRESIIVQTKVAPSADPQEFLDTFEKSISYLQLDYVDLLSIHGINNKELLEWTMRPGGCLEKAQQFQKEGRVRHIGFSTHALCHDILNAIETNAFDYVNLHWYFVNEFNWPAIEAAHKQDMGVFIISPNDKGGMLYKPSPELVELCHPLHPMQFNDLFCLHRPEVHTLSLGADKPSDFDEHVSALQWYDDIAQTITPIEQRLRQKLEDTHGKEWMATWWQGIPHWHDCPGELQVHEMLRLFTFVKAFHLAEYGQMRYNLLGNADHWFAGKNAKADFDEIALVEALKNNPFAQEIPAKLRELNRLCAGEEKKRLSQGD
ncbi:MAG: aldo/keto reductase [Verrucomicrobiota bacterium]